jgi:uncharacterized damage-inducible protein DinB
MSQPPIWFERKFEFTFPVEQHPNVAARLRGTPARLEELGRNADSTTWKAKLQGKWSAQEHAGHLLDLEELWLARVNDFAAGASQLTTADLSNRKTDEANHNARPLSEIFSAFRAARSKLMKRIDSLDAKQLGGSILHPRLKVPMRMVDHLFFVAEHDDHHLAAIWALIQRR